MTRATPLPPAERRAALIEATLPLLLSHGTTLTTKQVAEAAGVAEGTLFRYFPSLGDLIDAAIREALSPERLQRDLTAVEPGDSLHTISRAALQLLARRMADVRSLLHAVHTRPTSDDGACLRGELSARKDEIEQWLLRQLEPHVDELSVTPEQYVAYLRTLALGHVFTHGDSVLSPNDLAHLALVGAGKDPS